ncbi:ERAP1-like C-terminal domain-containing protein, partial [bacterium]|nr:ERAP1-like C-terminal domain-containing protein [bacterium]
TYRDTALLLDPDALTPSQRGLLVRWTAHELAHQWFGNFVTMEWWDDLWLNESFADWMGDRIAEEVRPALRTGERQLNGTQGTLRSDARPSSKAIRRPVTSGDQLMESVGVTYQKGKLVLAMFEQWMGEDAFRRGVLDYLETNAWGNATAADLWRALDDASGYDVSEALAGFLEQPSYPMLAVHRAGKGRIRVSQHRFRAAGVEVEPLRWDVPLVVRYADGRGTRTATLLLDEQEKTFELPADGPLEWIYPNGGARGYFRWKLSPDDWRALARAARRSLAPRERIEFLGNAGALVDAGEMHADAYLATLLDFADDERPTVSGSVMGGVGRMRNSFPDEDLEEAFAVYGRALLAPLLDRLGLEPRADEEEDATNLRPQVLAALGTWGRDGAIRAEALRRTAAYLQDESAIDPTLSGTWLTLAARSGDAELWETFERRYRSAEVPRERTRYLGLLGGFEDAKLRDRALRYVLEEKLAPQETFTIPMAQTGLGEEEQDRVVDWMLDHYDALAPRVPPPNRAFFPFLGSGCDEARWDRVREFFSLPGNQVPGTTSQMRRIDDSVADCLALRAREGEALRSYLRRFAAEHAGDPAPR